MLTATATILDLSSRTPYDAWAGQYAKFIEAYQNPSVPIWVLTSQIEPYTTGLWESNFWTAEDLVVYVNDHLSPAVREINPDIKIVIYDDQLTNLMNTTMTMAKGNLESSDGVGFHWYVTLESVYENNEPKPSVPFGNLPLVGGGAGVNILYNEYNGEKFLLMTEFCSGYAFGIYYLGPFHGSFAFGYNTAHDMLWDL